jgi:hypothetical protein
VAALPTLLRGIEFWTFEAGYLKQNSPTASRDEGPTVVKGYIRLNYIEKEDFGRERKYSQYKIKYIVTCLSNYRRGFGLKIEFIDHLHVVTTSNSNTVANFHTLHLTAASAKSFQSAVTSHFPVTDLYNGDFSASVLNCGH